MSNDRSQTPEEREVRNLLQPLEQVPPRAPNQAAEARAQFLGEADKLNSPVTFGALSRLKEWMRPQGQFQFHFRTLTIALVIAVFLLSGAGATAYASQQALPGAPLYQVKLWLEDTRLALSSDDTSDLELHLAFAQKRVDELRAVLSLGDVTDYGEASRNFESHIETAGLLVEELSQPENYESRLAEIVNAYNALHAEEDEEAPEQLDDLEETPEPVETDSPEAQDETPEAEDSGESQDEGEDVQTQESGGEDSSSEDDGQEGSEEDDDDDEEEDDDGTEYPTNDDEEDDGNEPDETDEPDES